MVAPAILRRVILEDKAVIFTLYLSTKCCSTCTLGLCMRCTLVEIRTKRWTQCRYSYTDSLLSTFASRMAYYLPSVHFSLCKQSHKRRIMSIINRPARYRLLNFRKSLMV